MTLIEAKNKSISTDWQLNGLSRLSFGFTAKRPLSICIAHIQNAPRGIARMRSVDVTIVNETICAFSLAETNRWFPVKVKGQLKVLDETTTLVAGEIHQKAPFMDWVLLIFLITLAMIFIEIVGIGGGFLSVVWLGGFALLIMRERRSRTVKMLTEVRRILDPKLAPPAPRKQLHE